MANIIFPVRSAQRGRPVAALALAAVIALLFAPARLALAQDAPGISTVDPTSGKVNDTITVTGTNLGKGSVSAVFLSDDKNDYKASIVNQEDTKIVMKVPQVKPGSYNVSIQKGNSIYIQPVRFTVQE
ncbi:MAG TPA: IPT/TIG domain-containing protein [Candidatus Acidoferrum sp.]|nr:IPT/TIG domain-containing protein [Candidatus Acidoferrum sp.]